MYSESSLTCKFLPLFLFTSCMNFHIWVLSGSGCSQSFLGRTLVSIMLFVCLLDDDDDDDEDDDMGVAADCFYGQR